MAAGGESNDGGEDGGGAVHRPLLAVHSQCSVSSHIATHGTQSEKPFGVVDVDVLD